MGYWTVIDSRDVAYGGVYKKEELGIRLSGNYYAEVWLGSYDDDIYIIKKIEQGVRYRARFYGALSSDGTNTTITTSGVIYPGESIVDVGSKYINGTVYLEQYVPTPPSTPSSISVPATIKGGETITISWSSSSGATRYHLERSVNGGSWTQIYQGSNRSYSDTITKGWNTVAYRVRAYNSDGYSGYRTSPTRTVINFPEMQIKINGVLKTSENGWVKINGVLREIDSIYVKVNGQLKEVQ